MKKRFFLALSLLVVCFLCPLLKASGQVTPGAGIHGAGSPDSRFFVTLESLHDAKVVDPQGLELGRVKSVELDLTTGSIGYLVVMPGTKDRLIPVPYAAFLLTPAKQLVLDVGHGLILSAPNYPKDSSPNWSDPNWTAGIQDFWSTGNTWKTAGGRVESAPLR